MSTIIIEYNSEVAIRRFLKKVFIKILQNSQESICATAFFSKVARKNLKNF